MNELSVKDRAEQVLEDAPAARQVYDQLVRTMRADPKASGFDHELDCAEAARSLTA